MSFCCLFNSLSECAGTIGDPFNEKFESMLIHRVYILQCIKKKIIHEMEEAKMKRMVSAIHVNAKIPPLPRIIYLFLI